MDDAALARPLTRIHAVINRKVAADHVGSGGSGILSQLVRLVLDVGRIFPVVYSYSASVSQPGAVRLEEWVWPVTALAEA